MMISAWQRVVSDIPSRWRCAREWAVAVFATGIGAGLAFALCSSARALAIAVTVVSVYGLVSIISPLKGLALWLVAQPILEKYVNISLGAGIPDLSFTRLCIGLVTVLLIARAAIRFYHLQSLNRFDVLALAFMVGMAQAGFRGSRGFSSFQNVLDINFIPLLVYFAVKNLVRDRRSMYIVLCAVVLVALYSACYAVYETMTGNVLFATREYKYYFYSAAGVRILRGIWGSNDSFGRVFIMAIPILFYFYLKASSSFRKIFTGFCLALVFWGMYLTYKRAAWIATVAVVFLMQFFYPQFRRLFVVLLIVVCVAFAFNRDSITSSDVYNERVNSKSSTLEWRTEGWRHGIEFWAASPLIGRGYRQYESLARKAGYSDVDLESEHLEILVSSGLIGFLPYLGLLFSMVYDGYRHYRGWIADSLADPDLVAVFWGILTGYVITVSTAQINNLAINAILFSVAGAIIYARQRTVST